MTTLDELRDRLEKAEGPDRVADHYIEAFRRGATVRMVTRGVGDDGERVLEPELRDAGGICMTGAVKVQPYTASLDAAIALVNAKLPGRMRDHTQFQDGSFRVSLIPHDRHPMDPSFAAEHKSEPIALLLALLSALEKESAE